MIVALIVDATIVRILLVPGHDAAARPARTGGRPAPLRRLYARYGISEAEKDPSTPVQV